VFEMKRGESNALGRAANIVRHESTHTWFVPKVSILIFYLNVYWTHLKLQVISFKV